MKMGAWEKLARMDRKDLLAVKDPREPWENKVTKDPLGAAEMREDPAAREKEVTRERLEREE